MNVDEWLDDIKRRADEIHATLNVAEQKGDLQINAINREKALEPLIAEVKESNKCLRRLVEDIDDIAKYTNETNRLLRLLLQSKGIII